MIAKSAYEQRKEDLKNMVFDKIFRGYRIVSKSAAQSLQKDLTEEIHIGFFTDYMSGKTQYRNVGDMIIIQWAKDSTSKISLPENGISENSMQLKGFLDWYHRVTDPSFDKVIQRLDGYGFIDITDDESLKTTYHKLIMNFSEDKREIISPEENSILGEIFKYDNGELKLSHLNKLIQSQMDIFAKLTSRI